MKTHHRNYSYRPPRRVKGNESGGFDMVRRFAAVYLTPFKWPIILCVVLAAINGCSFYLMTYYTRIVVDDILVIQTGSQPGEKHKAVDAGAWSKDNRSSGRPLPGSAPMRLMDRGEPVSNRPAEAGRKLMLIFCFYVASLVLLNLLGRLAQRTHIRIGQQLTARLREDLHSKILELSVAYHKVHTPGRLLARITSDVEIIQQQMLSLILAGGRNVIVFLLGATILLVSNWRMALIVLSLMPLYAAVYRRAAPAMRSVSREQRHTNSCMYGLVSQKLDATKVIQSYWRQGLERLCFHRLAACFLRDALALQRLRGSMSCAAQIISGVATGALFLVGARHVLAGNMSLGQMLYLYGISATLFMPVLQLTMLSIQFNHLVVIVHRLVEVLEEEPEIVDKPDAVAFPAPIREGITLNNVGFRYGPETESDPVLRTVSLRIPAGTWLCVMGPSGSGKSTLLHILARLCETSWGQVSVDGIPLTRIKIRSFRNRVSLVPQEARIFSGTIRDNICYGFPGAEPQQIMNAARAAEVHRYIMELPVKYETMLGEKGVTLSGGQRQRLSLARALLTDPEVLLLDDCTSALDADTERKIQDTLARILVGKTAIIVSQRVSMAKRCHRICTIENGIVSEFGNHDDLVRKGGFYARLHEQQSGHE